MIAKNQAWSELSQKRRYFALFSIYTFFTSFFIWLFVYFSILNVDVDVLFFSLMFLAAVQFKHVPIRDTYTNSMKICEYLQTAE